MKVLIYSLNFAPEITGIGKYSGEMVDWLALRGHEVRVVCAPPHYPHWRVLEGFSASRYRREQRGSVQVWRAPLWVPRDPSGWRRVLHLLSFALSSLPVMLRQVFWRPDIVLVVAPALACAPNAWITARMCGAKAWLHVQDFELDVAFRMGHLKGGMLQRLGLWAESWLLRRFDVVSTISHKMLERLRSKGVADGRLEHFPNWCDIRTVMPLRRDSPYRAELGFNPDDKIFMFSGTLGSKQGLEIILEVAERLVHRPDIQFIVAGEGVMKPVICRAADRLPNLHWLPLQPLDRVSDFLGLAHAHLLPQAAAAEDLVLPSKLTGMLASGRPVIATCSPDSEMARTLRTCGCAVDSASAEAMAREVLTLADDPERAGRLGRQARLYAETHLAQDAVLERWEASMFRFWPAVDTFADTVPGVVADLGRSKD